MKKNAALLVSLAVIGLCSPMTVQAQDIADSKIEEQTEADSNDMNPVSSQSDNDNKEISHAEGKQSTDAKPKEDKKIDTDKKDKEDGERKWYRLSFMDILMQLLVGIILFVIPGFVIFYRAKKN